MTLAVLLLFSVYVTGLALDGNLVVEDEEEALAVSLLHFEVQENGGCTLSSYCSLYDMSQVLPWTAILLWRMRRRR